MWTSAPGVPAPGHGAGHLLLGQGPRPPPPRATCPGISGFPVLPCSLPGNPAPSEGGVRVEERNLGLQIKELKCPQDLHLLIQTQPQHQGPSGGAGVTGVNRAEERHPPKDHLTHCPPVRFNQSVQDLSGAAPGCEGGVWPLAGELPQALTLLPPSLRLHRPGVGTGGPPSRPHAPAQPSTHPRFPASFPETRGRVPARSLSAAMPTHRQHALRAANGTADTALT